MNEQLRPGWHTNERGEQQYWDGQQWLASDAGTPSPNVPPKRRKAPWLVGAGAGAVAMVVAGVYLGSSPSPETAAQDGCTDAVLDELETPNSAVFSDYQTGPMLERFDYMTAVLLLRLAAEHGEDFRGFNASDILEETGAQHPAREEIEDSPMGAWAASDDFRELSVTTGWVDWEIDGGETAHREFVCLYDPEGDGADTSLLALGHNPVSAHVIFDLREEFAKYDN